MMNYKSIVIAVTLAGLLAPACMHARATSSDDEYPREPSHHVTDVTVTAGLRATPILHTNYFVRGSNVSGRPLDMGYAPFAELSMRNAPGSRYGRWYPSAYQGVGVGVQMASPGGVLGTPALLYVMQGARLASLGERLTLDYEWNFGAAMGWKSMDHDSPDYVRNLDGMGTPVTAYINFGLYLRYRLTPRLGLLAGAEVTHYSNGNTGDPNPGLNMLGARVGLSYTLGTPAVMRRADWSDFEPGMVYDLALYGAWRKWSYTPYPGINIDGVEGGKSLAPGKFGVAGFNLTPMYRFNPLLSAGVSVDGQYDEGAALSSHYVTGTPSDDPRFYRPSFSDRIMLGLSARVELRMSLFAINVGLGHSVLAPGGHDLRGWYNTFSLKTFVTDRFFLLTGYKLYRFNEPGNLMLGAGVRFGR
ncbi:MAG: acyloxyacyl hydrolase [Duncaniella sp.]|nr:acyloxyacyl hydrolase [Duncaniella sp.]